MKENLMMNETAGQIFSISDPVVLMATVLWAINRARKKLVLVRWKAAGK